VPVRDYPLPVRYRPLPVVRYRPAAVGSSPAQQIANKLVGTEDPTTGATITSATVSGSSIVVCPDSTALGRCNSLVYPNDSERAADWNANGYYLGTATGEVQMSDGNQYVVDIFMNPDTGAILWQEQS
jgi:hypothetical protein